VQRLTEKLPNAGRDKTCRIFQREVAGINQMQFRVREISLVGLGPFDGEERVVLSPENQHSRLLVAKVFMPTVVERDIRLIVVKKVELNCRVARTIEEKLVHRIGIRADL
jgi:hypothetical protein